VSGDLLAQEDPAEQTADKRCRRKDDQGVGSGGVLERVDEHQAAHRNDQRREKPGPADIVEAVQE